MSFPTPELNNFTGGIVKIGPGHDPNALLAYVLKDASPHTNAGKMSCRVVVSASGMDRDREWVEPRGLILDDHRANPIALFLHNRALPIGMAEDPLSKNYTVRLDSHGRLIAETFFNQKSQLGVDAFRLVESGAMRGASVGFTPIVGMIHKSQASDNGPPITIYRGGRVVEYSHIPIPSHPECLVEVVHKGFGGKPICDPLLDMLRPLVPDRPEAVTSGWDPVEKGRYTYKTCDPLPIITREKHHVCPHCEQEVRDKSTYVDDDGTVRHGPCRGAIIFPIEVPPAPPEAAQPVVVPAPAVVSPAPPVVTMGAKAASSDALVTKMADQLNDDDPLNMPDDPLAQDDPLDQTQQDDPAADAKPDHDELVKSSLASIVNSLVDQAMSGECDPKEALGKIKHLFDTHQKLKDSGDDGDMPDLKKDADPEDLADDGEGDGKGKKGGDADADADDSDDDEEKKDKMFLAWSPEGEAFLTKTYKLYSTILATPEISEEKLCKVVKELLGDMENLGPVQKQLKAGTLKTKAAKAPEPVTAVVPDGPIQVPALDSDLLASIMDGISKVHTTLGGRIAQ